MPFRDFPHPQLPSPLVEMLFRGLIIITPGAVNTSLIWIHTAPDDHFLIVEIRGKSRRMGDFLILRHTGPITNPPLTVAFDQGSAGVFAFKPHPRPFDRKTASDRRDLGWTIDLEHAEFHGAALAIAAGTPVSIQMSDGVFFTADVTDERNLDVGRKRGSADYVALRQISTVVCANISPPAGASVVLDRAGVSGWPITLPRAGDDADTRYRVSIRNDPPVIDFQPSHDELERYYELVKMSGGGNIPPRDRFELDVRPRRTGGRSTDEIPCMPIMLGG